MNAKDAISALARKMRSRKLPSDAVAEGVEWEQRILEATTEMFIPRNRLNEIPDTVILLLGLPNSLQSKLSKTLRKTKRIGQFRVGTYCDVPIAVVCQSIGSINTEIILRVLTRTRAKTVIGVGFVGALQNNISIGSFILPTLALRGEGTTAYYAPQEVQAVPSPMVQTAIENAMPSDVSFHKGKVFTTAAMIKEEDALITRLARDGVLGIECETSALFLISKIYGINAGAILQVTDNPLLKIVWSDPRFKRELLEGSSQLVRVVYEAAKNLSAKTITRS